MSTQRRIHITSTAKSLSLLIVIFTMVMSLGMPTGASGAATSGPLETSSFPIVTNRTFSISSSCLPGALLINGHMCQPSSWPFGPKVGDHGAVTGTISHADLAPRSTAACLVGALVPFGAAPTQGNFRSAKTVCYTITLHSRTRILVTGMINGLDGYFATNEARLNVVAAGGKVSDCSSPIDDTQDCWALGRIQVQVHRGKYPTFAFWIYDLSRSAGCSLSTLSLSAVPVTTSPSMLGSVSCYDVSDTSTTRLAANFWSAGSYPSGVIAINQLVTSTNGTTLCTFGTFAIAGCVIHGPVRVLLSTTGGGQIMGSYDASFYGANRTRGCTSVHMTSSTQAIFSWAPTANTWSPVWVRADRCFTVKGPSAEIGVSADLNFPAVLSVLSSNGSLIHPLRVITGVFATECYAAHSADTVVISDNSPPISPFPQAFFIHFSSCLK